MKTPEGRTPGQNRVPGAQLLFLNGKDYILSLEPFLNQVGLEADHNNQAGGFQDPG